MESLKAMIPLEGGVKVSRMKSYVELEGKNSDVIVGRCVMGEDTKGKYDLRKWGSSIPLGIRSEYKSTKEVCWLCGKRVREWNSHGCKWCGAKYCNKCIWKTDIKKCPKCKAIEKKALDDFLG